VDVARILDQKGLAPESELIELAWNAEFAGSLGLKANSLEGYLFPETYHFKKPVSTGNHSQRQWCGSSGSNLPQEWSGRAKQLGLSLHQIVTLASIIEKEAALIPNGPLSPGFSITGLESPCPSKATRQRSYDIPGFSGPVTAAHLTRQSPYNTLPDQGLPPGPICSPGQNPFARRSIPKRSHTFISSAIIDGTHHFSVTSDEHRSAVFTLFTN